LMPSFTAAVLVVPLMSFTLYLFGAIVEIT
jgi:hypothetical protein